MNDSTGSIIIFLCGKISLVTERPQRRRVTRFAITGDVIKLTILGVTGGLLGTAVGGPPKFIIYLITTLLILGSIFYEVDNLIKR